MSDCNCLAEIAALRDEVETKFATRLEERENLIKAWVEPQIAALEHSVADLISTFRASSTQLENRFSRLDEAQVVMGRAILKHGSVAKLEVGTEFVVISHVQSSEAESASDGAIVVTRMTREGQPARLCGASFWCSGSNIHCSGGLGGSEYQALFVCRPHPKHWE
jgi:hypothetical protein